MTAKRFFSKLFSPYIWLNLLAMGIIVVLLCLGLKYGLDLYTHHGQTVEVPTIIHKSYNDAEDMLDKVHLNIVVSDTDYVKTLPPDCILEQSPLEGEIVKPGRIVYVKINAPHTPCPTSSTTARCVMRSRNFLPWDSNSLTRNISRESVSGYMASSVRADNSPPATACRERTNW